MRRALIRTDKSKPATLVPIEDRGALLSKALIDPVVIDSRWCRATVSCVMLKYKGPSHRADMATEANLPVADMLKPVPIG